VVTGQSKTNKCHFRATKNNIQKKQTIGEGDAKEGYKRGKEGTGGKWRIEKAGRVGGKEKDGSGKKGKRKKGDNKRGKWR